MIINQANLAAIYRGFDVLFQKAFQEAKSSYQQIATVVRTPGKKEITYAWLGQMPGLKEWIGDKQIQSVEAHDYTIKNKEWESTIEVDRVDIETDSIGVYTPLVQMLAQAAKVHPDELVIALLNGAFTQTCYDGQYFVDTDHPYSGGTQSNKGTAALAATAYEAARSALLNMKGDDGRVLNLNPNLLVVDPTKEGAGRSLVKTQINASGASNPWYNTAELLVLPGLTAGYWFLMDVSKPIKPLLVQQRKAPVPVNQISPDSDAVFSRRKYRYGVEASHNAGYALWQLCYGSDGTT